MRSGKKRNLHLLIVFTGLVVISILLATGGESATSLDVDKRKFAIEPQTVITDVILKGKEFEHHFHYNNEEWILEDRFKMDIGMRDVLFTVLSTVEIRRPVSTARSDSIRRHLEEEGTHVMVKFNDEVIKSYYAGGDPSRGVTWFMNTDEKIPYIMRLPGYQSYVAGIFKVPELDWKDRTVFETDWLSLEGMTWEYPDDPGKRIEFVPSENLFTIKGLADIDTTRAMNYLESVIFLQADRYIREDEYARYESLVALEPEIVCTVDDHIHGSQVLELYPPKEEKSPVLGVLNGREYVLFNHQRISNLYRRPEQFVRQEQTVF